MDLLQIIFPVAGIKTYLFIPPAVAFTISFFTSMAGISGAFLLLPFQMSVLGFTSTSVTSTNFLFNSETWIKLVLGIIVFIIASRYVLKFFI